jgi:hypothetical protein
VNENKHYLNLLIQNKYYVIPSVNVDGVAYIEDRFVELGFLEPKRTNMSYRSNGKCGDRDSGVDLNRNYGFNFAQGSSSDAECKGDTYHGPSGFSEPET